MKQTNKMAIVHSLKIVYSWTISAEIISTVEVAEKAKSLAGKRVTRGLPIPKVGLVLRSAELRGLLKAANNPRMGAFGKTIPAVESVLEQLVENKKYDFADKKTIRI